MRNDFYSMYQTSGKENAQHRVKNNSQFCLNSIITFVLCIVIKYGTHIIRNAWQSMWLDIDYRRQSIYNHFITLTLLWWLANMEWWELTTDKLNHAWASCVRMLSSSISCILFSSFLKNEPLNYYKAILFGIIISLSTGNLQKCLV